MIAEAHASFLEELHLGAAAQARQGITALARPRERIAAAARHAEFPFELFVIGFEIVIIDGPIEDLVTGQVGLGALSNPACDLSGEDLEVSRHEAGSLPG